MARVFDHDVRRLGLARRWLGALVSCGVLPGLVVVACGSREELAENSGMSAHEPTRATDLAPPTNIDAVTCAGALRAAGASDSATERSCRECCSRTPFPLSSVYRDLCLCGKLLNPSGNLACRGEFLVQAECSACCQRAGFDFGLGPSGDVAECRCSGKSDEVACASTLQASEPQLACQACCINHGYLGVAYTAFGTPVCDCIDGSF